MIKEQGGKEVEMTSHYKISDYCCIKSIWGKNSLVAKCILLVSFEPETFMWVLQITDSHLVVS